MSDLTEQLERARQQLAGSNYYGALLKEAVTELDRLTEDRRVLTEALKEIAETVVHAPEGGHEEVAECVRIARAALEKVSK